MREVPELVEKKVKGEELNRRAQERLVELLTLYPENSSADGAGFSLAVARIGLGETERVLELCERLRARHPKSAFVPLFCPACSREDGKGWTCGQPVPSPAGPGGGMTEVSEREERMASVGPASSQGRVSTRS